MAEDITNPDFLATYQTLYPTVDKAVDATIEKEKDAYRHPEGDGTFLGDLWATLKGWFFQIAEFMGFDGWLAEQMGAHIPSESETTDLKQQIATSTAKVLTAEGPNGDFLATSMTPDQLEAAVTERVAADLEGNAAVKGGFSAAQRSKAATAAGAGVKEKFADTVKGLAALKAGKAPAPKAETIPVVAGATPEENIRKALNGLADGILADPLVASMSKGKEDKLNALKPKIIDIGAQLIKDKKELLNDPAKFTDAFLAELQKKNALGELGLDLSNPSIRPMVQMIFAKHVEAHKENLLAAANGTTVTQAPPPPATPKAPEVAPAAPAPDPQLTKNMIKGMLQATITERTVAGTCDKVVSSCLTTTGKAAVGKFMYDTELKAVETLIRMHKRYNVDITKGESLQSPPVSDIHMVTIKTARDKVYDWAARTNRTFDKAQLNIVSETIADSMLATLSNPDNKALSPEQMAGNIRAGVAESLANAQEKIDAANPANTIATINGTSLFKGKITPIDIINVMSDAIGTAIYDPKRPDDKSMYEKLIMAQERLLQVKVTQAAQRGGIEVGGQPLIMSMVEGDLIQAATARGAATSSATSRS